MTAEAVGIPSARAHVRLQLGVTGWAAAIVLVVVVLMAVFAPVLAPHDPNAGDLLSAYADPSFEHWLGTDSTGRDVASRVLYGAGTSLLGPAAIVVLSLLVGIPLSLAAAWFGGVVSFAITRLLDMVFAIPGLLLAILAVSLFGPGLWPAVITLAIAYLPYIGRLAVTTAEMERRLPYVQALSVQGQGVVQINLRHILRNLAPILAGNATIAFAYALIDLAGLSFLGLAVQAPQSDWGVLVSDRDALLRGHPTQVVTAAVLIVATVLSLFVIGARLTGERPSLGGWLRRPKPERPTA
jgi:peptide/nickel transport system permease protein